MTELAFALSPAQFARSVAASRDTLGKVQMKLVDVVRELSVLTGGAPYAVVGGLAQILWARKTHTDDLDVTLAQHDLRAAYNRVRDGLAPEGWSLPRPPDEAHEQNDVFEVYHLLYREGVVDILSFADVSLTGEIIDTACVVPELGNLRFVRPELLLVTQLLRPGARAALAAVELVIARREHGGMDASYCEHWATRLGKLEAYRRALQRADQFTLG